MNNSPLIPEAPDMYCLARCEGADIGFTAVTLQLNPYILLEIGKGDTPRDARTNRSAEYHSHQL